ncbi:hypothetical protein K0U91_01745 [Chryseobacterium chendengshani]|uniref:hypothetical protein n=1 Tax=Chryseobacterium sp. LJ668 TaxID=2864040 RepID=UPI001C687586|nr:hypothetical protein [Chryseobacterium sp. LJ668]MBW8523950.1 hypothetical protein [Chryseobacterium sp. LJ668]QYK16890.1 hypothetical protein K0U91_01745 [Chryseobacterium sp. LJ668]
MKNLLLPFLLILALVFSCRSENDEMLEKNANSVNLYIAGAENNQACYWKNGQKVILSNGTGLYASQIIVENNNVYVYGAMTSEYTLNLSSKHLYLWINGTKNNLDEYLQDVPDPNPSNNFQISSRMIVENGNIYFCGSITNSTIPSQTNQTYYYWKNGIKYQISNDPALTSPGMYQLINNEIYLGIRKNYQYNPLTWETGFYKNNIYSPLTNDSQILDFLTDNTGTYAYVKNILTGEKTLRNINTNAVIAFPSNPPGEILDVTWSNNDKYFIGDNFYYKNNTLVQLNDPNGYNRIRGFKVKDQQIYTIRYKDGSNVGTTVKVFINDVEVQSQPITGVSDPNVGGFLSIFID